MESRASNYWQFGIDNVVQKTELSFSLSWILITYNKCSRRIQGEQMPSFLDPHDIQHSRRIQGEQVVFGKLNT
jgi:hypothetical protein